MVRPGAGPVGEMEVRIDLLVKRSEDWEPAALRRAVLEALKDHLESLEPESWTVHDTKELSVMDAPFHAPAERRPPRPGKPVVREDVSLRPHQRRLCNRLVETVFLLGVRGKAVALSDIERSGRMPIQATQRLLKEDSETAKYLAPYLNEWRDRGKRMFDLTEEGRKLASLVRAGEVPA